MKQGEGKESTAGFKPCIGSFLWCVSSSILCSVVHGSGVDWQEQRESLRALCRGPRIGPPRLRQFHIKPALGVRVCLCRPRLFNPGDYHLRPAKTSRQPSSRTRFALVRVSWSSSVATEPFVELWQLRGREAFASISVLLPCFSPLVVPESRSVALGFRAPLLF